MGCRGRACAWFVLLVVGSLVGAAPAGARLLVKIPPTLASQVTQPCVLYACAANPAPHTNWENTLGALPANYCTVYTCSPMDLIPDNGFDDNLFPLNPDWAYVTQTGQPPDALALCQRFTSGLGSPSCSTYPVTYDLPGADTLAWLTCPLGRKPYTLSFHGHVNWETATYEGNLIWDSKSDVGTDDDYSFDLQTLGGHGVTAGNTPGTIHLEFDSDETIDHFDSSPWWQHFHHIVDNGYGAGNPNGGGPGKPPHHPFAIRPRARPDAHAASVGDYINGDFAVVTGLIGLDTAHTPAAESHPVYAMAIQSDRQQALAGGTDTWAIFARDFGNEGFCSQHDHPIPAGPITLRIPWQVRPSRLAGIPPRPATQVTVTSTNDLWSNISPDGTGSVSILPGQGVLLTLNVSEPASKKPLYWGTIDLKWTWSSAPPPSEMTTFAPFGAGAIESQVADGSGGSGENSDVEAIAHRIWQGLPAAARARAFAALPQPRLDLVAHRTHVGMAAPPEAPLRPLSRFITSTTDGTQLALGRSEEKQLCIAFRDRVPGHRAICAGQSTPVGGVGAPLLP